MGLLRYFYLCLGLAKIEAKKDAGENVFSHVCTLLPKKLGDTDDEQIDYFSKSVLPKLSKEDVECLKVYLHSKIIEYQTDGSTTGEEEQICSKWSGIYGQFLEALPE